MRLSQAIAYVHGTLGSLSCGVWWVLCRLSDVQLQDMLARHVYLSFLVQQVVLGMVRCNQCGYLVPYLQN